MSPSTSVGARSCAQAQFFACWAKAIDVDCLDQIDAILERFDLRAGVSLKAIEKRKALAKWIGAQEELGIEVELPEKIAAEAFRQSYKDLTVEEFRGLVDSVKQIEHLGRLKEKLLTASDNRRFADVVREITTSIEDNAGGKRANNRTRDTAINRAVNLFKGFLASHRKAASLARELDGFKDAGPVWTYLIQSMNAAGDREATMRADATMRLTEMLQPVLAEGRMGGNPLLTGALYYRTTAPIGMKVYDGAQWIEASAAQQASLVTYEYVATAGQTTFSGADANGVTLSYTVGNVLVTQNGSRLRPGDDFTATTGTSIVLLVTVAAGDEIIIDALKTFDVANTYTQAQVNALLAQRVAKSGDTMGALTVGARLTVDGANNGNITEIPMTRTDASYMLANQTALRVYGQNANTTNPNTKLLETQVGGSLALQGAGTQTGTGITFPATQSASSNANTLDDYEEGTFTATWWTGLNGTGTNLGSSTNNRYTKIGRAVIISFARENVGGATNAGSFTGLPFANDPAFGISGVTADSAVFYADSSTNVNFRTGDGGYTRGSFCYQTN